MEVFQKVAKNGFVHLSFTCFPVDQILTCEYTHNIICSNMSCTVGTYVHFRLSRDLLYIHITYLVQV